MGSGDGRESRLQSQDTLTADEDGDELWHILTQYLPTLPKDSYVCMNNLAPFMRTKVSARRALNHKSMKKVLSRLRLNHYMSVSSVAADRLYSTGGPMRVRVRGGCLVNVYAWVDGARKYNAQREHLFLVKAEDLQVYILMTRKCVARRIVNMTNEAVKYTAEDIVPFSLHVAGIHSP